VDADIREMVLPRGKLCYLAEKCHGLAEPLAGEPGRETPAFERPVGDLRQEVGDLPPIQRCRIRDILADRLRRKIHGDPSPDRMKKVLLRREFLRRAS
jgi:hypothetical protein